MSTGIIIIIYKYTKLIFLMKTKKYVLLFKEAVAYCCGIQEYVIEKRAGSFLCARFERMAHRDGGFGSTVLR